MSDPSLRLTPLELASSVVVGEAPVDPLPSSDGGGSPLAAFEEATRLALARPPCLVSFSGGRDSSAVLAVAAEVARREGLDPPVPVTMRFAGAISADESGWQERVVGHLGLADWHRIDFEPGAYDFVGPVAEPVLQRHGVLYPPNAFAHAPLFEAARGGSFLTGVGGDDMLGGWQWEALGEVAARRRRPTPRDLLRLASALGGPPPRRAVMALRRRHWSFPWLRPAADRSVLRALRDEEAREPVRWSRRVAWKARRRYAAMRSQTLALLARDAGTEVHHPFVAPAFIRALAGAGRSVGLGDRTGAMRALFAHVLPEDVIARPDKAILFDVFWTSRARAFAEGWDGGGVDPAIVDRDWLRAHWQARLPHAATAMLIQSAWIASRRGDRRDPVEQAG